MLKKREILVLVLLGAALSAAASSVTGDDWRVYFSLPDQNFNENPGEYDIRNALLARIDALGSNDQATLATYTFSAEGTAGKIVRAISNALARSAVVRFVGDYGLDTNAVLGGTSLGALAARPTNPLILVKATNSSGIMHDKIGLFSYGGTNRWVFTGSWNFTSAASYQQWNIAVEAQNDAMYAAFSNELAQLLAGYFHYNSGKSHAYDVAFRLLDAWSNCWVRFSPPASGSLSASNAQSDILSLISNAEDEIVFGLNDLTLTNIARQLVRAADRGVSIHGSMPKSDTDPGGGSDAVYAYLTNAANYATTNVVHFITAYANATNGTLDSGETDLVHEKYMLIDPLSSHPTVIFGSANWSSSALVYTNMNDENVVFLRHQDIARMFYAQFKRMTGLWQDRDDYGCDLARSNGGVRVGLWMTDTNRYSLEYSSSVMAGSWTTDVTVVTGSVLRSSVVTNAAGPVEFFRVRRQ